MTTERPSLPIEGDCERGHCTNKAEVRIELTDMEIVRDSCTDCAGDEWIADPDNTELKGYKE